MLCDDRYGQDALNAATGRGWWIGRPVELPGSQSAGVRPRALDRHDAHRVAARARREVPRAVPPRRRRSTSGSSRRRRLRALYDAVQASGHELLLEIIPPQVAAARARTRVLRAMKRLYNLGIYPEWWKLEPMARGAVARARRADRRARSALPRRGAARPQRAASTRSRGASATRAASASCRGFAVGRTIFHEPSRAWLAGDDRRRGAQARVCATQLRSADRCVARRRDARSREVAA